MKQTTRGDGAAFLLAQVGAHVSSKFATRMAAIELSPPLVGVLRFLSRNPGSTQRELADAIGMPPSRLVAMIDALERRGFVQRVRGEDRRAQLVTLTDDGKAELAAIAKEARAHKNDVLAALSAKEQDQLAALLERIAEQQGLRPGVHPGLARAADGTEPRSARR